MENKAHKVLEFDKILAKLAAHTDSETVKERIFALKPFTTLSDARYAQKETTEAVGALLKLGAPAVRLSVTSIVAGVRRADNGGGTFGGFEGVIYRAANEKLPWGCRQ